MGFGTFQRKKDDVLKLIILLEMVEIWLCIIVIIKLFFIGFVVVLI